MAATEQKRCWRCGHRFDALVPDPLIRERPGSLCVACAFDRAAVAYRYAGQRPLSIVIPDGDA